MNSFEQFLVEFLIEGGINSKGTDRPGEERIAAHKDRTTKRYQQIAIDPDAPEEDKRDADQYLERGKKWKSGSPRDKYGK